MQLHQVGVGVISSRTVYIEEPNFFPATTWGVPEVTPSGVVAFGPSSVESIASTSDNTPYSFPTSNASFTTPPTTTSPIETLPIAKIPTPVPQGNISGASVPSTTDVSISAAPTTLVPVVNEQAAVTISACDSGVAGVTIPVSDLTTGEFVAAYVTCAKTIYIQEPNFYPTKTYYGISSLSDSSSTSSPSTSSCNSDIAGVTIAVSDLTIGEFVAAYVTCGKIIYIQEPNFYTPKTYYGIPASAATNSAAASSATALAVIPPTLEARAGKKPAYWQNRPTSIHKSVPSGVAGNRGAEMLRARDYSRMREVGL